MTVNIYLQIKYSGGQMVVIEIKIEIKCNNISLASICEFYKYESKYMSLRDGQTTTNTNFMTGDLTQ